ncbi:S-layer homology domain-containing protein [Gorillibacterium sp. sgz5001074]|uniref:S-layer homology domain-containing protein n=1 Tax=Gorillibacterium sp. sgz5001074 TaxID=3446695 RepID=UPI003F667A08
MNTKKTWTALTLSSLLVGSLTFGTAFAFNDLDPENSAAVQALQERGIVSGVDDQHFVPKGKITYAEGVQLLVKAFGLNIDNVRFIKQPLASDYFTNVPNDAWYAKAFIIAQVKGMELPRDVNPTAPMTREQFGELLVRTLEKQGNYPLIKMYIHIQDEDQITPEYQGALQRLLLYKIAELDRDGRFHPKDELTRGQAAVWLNKALAFKEAHAEKPAPAEQVELTVEKIADGLNRITLSRGEKPNAGYGIAITGIRFGEDGKAIVTYKLTDPQPGMSYAEVLTTPKAVTYVSSDYQVQTEQADSGKSLK